MLDEGPLEHAQPRVPTVVALNRTRVEEEHYRNLVCKSGKGDTETEECVIDRALTAHVSMPTLQLLTHTYTKQKRWPHVQ